MAVVTFGAESREIERKLRRVPSCRLVVTEANMLTSSLVVVAFQQEEKLNVGKNPDGSDFCNGLHWVPWYTQE